jgi:DNA-binding GntR family transcriptional regulator
MLDMAAHPKSFSRGAATDDVTALLREAILDGRLPPHSWLREQDLAALFQVSRTPVREALRRLADEQLVERTANRGCRVKAMTVEDVLAVYLVRESLESLAARIAAQKATPALVARLTELHEQMSAPGITSAEMAELNLHFHRAIRAQTGNAYLERFLTQVEHAVRRFGTSTFEDPQRVPEIHEEHRQIIEAIAAGDGAAAEKVTGHHMRCARDARIKHLLSLA